MQFEGNWTPVTDIVVDKVGKYAYVIGSIHDTAATPVVMDVILDVRTKVSALDIVMLGQVRKSLQSLAALPTCTSASFATRL